ncbi:hypothetical protein QTA56_13115 [Acinetobacter sp. VNH17]|uniref:Lipoprotein n=1 Tax=Acinetobacter thutiue TaxID=2998078 RepID=A0ABT7WR71_9GAMM|nr:hypothetical protein [Acinetobacter thutiue]MCY6413060.1 hypothetical protein [Acinetobacter thutiue]MDN0015168.1 hypothetical protein [Acinetobacter thutiue]
MKNNSLFIFSMVLLMGCHTPDQGAEQQQNICKTLAQGYLKIQNQQTYEFWRLEKVQTQAQQSTLRLTYKQPTENGVIMSNLLLPTVEFVCQQQQQHIALAIKQPTGQIVRVLELQLPEQTIGTPKSRDLIAQTRTQ